MVIKKFKTFEEAEMDLWNMNPDAEWVKKAFRLFKVMRFSKRPPVKKGVSKFRTIEEAELDREKYEGT